MMGPMRRTWTVLAVAAACPLALLVPACSSGGGDGATGTTLPAEPPPATPGAALPETAVRCLDAPVRDGVADEAAATPVACTDTHRIEEFRLSGNDVYACVTTIAASSDLQVGPDPSSDQAGRQAVLDRRVAGHEYATATGGGVQCRITLVDPVEGAVLG